MRTPFRRPLLAALFLLFSTALPAPVAAEEPPSLEALRAEIQALRQELARLASQPPPPPAADHTAELERRIDLLAAELEKVRTSGAADEKELEGVKGLAPAASKVYGVARGVSIGGYGEAVYENFAQDNQAGAASGKTDQFDYLRQVLYVGYKFSDRILFNSEIEFEHASTGKGGEVSVEFGYLEFQPWRAVGLRAGMLLVPVGFLNELHEPPIFLGARRPEVEQAILPSTWRENGAGAFGEAGPFAWRAYVISGLASSGFSAAGIRGGRQSGARSKAEDLGLTARLDFSGVDGLLIGGALFSGESGQGATLGTTTIGGRVTLFDLHAQYERRGLQLRALYARSTIEDVAGINAKNSLSGSKSVGEAQYGWYVQGGYDVMTLASSSRWSVIPFLRYERLDTQDGVPTGFAEDPATDRSIMTLGVGVKPIANVVLKADYQWISNQADTGTNQLNLAVGYLF